MSKILERLYLGCYSNAKNLTLLKNLKITHIVTVGLELKPIYPLEFTYLHIPAYDMEEFKLGKYFDQITEFIHDAIHRQRGVVFVHCMCGISRSTASVIAYLIKHEGMTYTKAAKFVKSKREIARPNPGFVEQLLEWEKTCKKSNKPISHETPKKGGILLEALKSMPTRIYEEAKLDNKSAILNITPKKKLESLGLNPFAATVTPLMNKTIKPSNFSKTMTRAFSVDPTKEPSSAALTLNLPKEEDGEYVCKSCKCSLFKNKNIISHKQLKRHPYEQCTFIFVEHMPWIKYDNVPMARIYCPNPKCNQIIGFINQTGGKCSCGFWMREACQFFPVKIEKTKLIISKQIHYCHHHHHHHIYVVINTDS